MFDNITVKFLFKYVKFYCFLAFVTLHDVKAGKNLICFQVIIYFVQQN